MDERSRRVASAFEIPVVVAALPVIPVIAIEQSSLSDPWKTIAAVTNWIIWIVFAAELVAMLAVVPSRLRWLRDNPLEVAIVVLTPPLLPASLQALRAFRLLRLLRLLRLAKIARHSFSVEGVKYAALLAVLTALGGGAAFSAAEKGHSTWDGVWWAVTTMTTVGYGDLSPQSDTGRVLGIFVMLVGIGFIALVTGAVAERFLAGDVQEIEDEVAEEVEATEAILRELRAVRERLAELETRVQRLART
jgi:voltage-gated potassium channel